MKTDGENLTRKLGRDRSGDTLEQDETGALRATCAFVCAWSAVLRLMPRRQVSKHPDFSNMLCDRVSVERDGTLAKISASYVGGQGTGGGGGNDNADSAPVVQVYSSVSQEPIETHPRFTDNIAGSTDSPLWEGVYDAEGKFAGFPKDDGAGNDCPFFGVTSYLAPRTIVRRTKLSRVPPANTRVGFLDTPPTGGGTRYLKTVHGYTREGALYREEEEWMAPADGSTWDDTIYEEG